MTNPVRGQSVHYNEAIMFIYHYQTTGDFPHFLSVHVSAAPENIFRNTCSPCLRSSL